jgi:L-alanine-DL-glutamate epimerase-like enolase superfamily enzyme
MPRPTRVEIHCFRYPLDLPMETVFGRVSSRPALLVRIEDEQGAFGWGEIWCNFPQPGAEYRARLAAAVVPRALAGIDTAQPEGAFSRIRARLHGLALQAGEPGPADQIASGLDIALHDLAARRAGVPLATYLGGAPRALPVYASGIDSRLGERMIGQARQAGYRAFKLRVGFGRASTLETVRRASDDLARGEVLMIDANQNWDLDEALWSVDALAGLPLAWIEEPLPVDRPAAEWETLAHASKAPLAGGENIRSASEFGAAIDGPVLRVIQPDICKWGGLSACAELARRIVASGKRYCPHYLGGGVGLAASAHLLAAAGGDGLLEVDVNDNLLRDALAGPLLPLSDGQAAVPDGPGLGYVPDVASVSSLRVEHFEVDVPAGAKS